jgi:HlyD family secretion protein
MKESEGGNGKPEGDKAEEPKEEDAQAAKARKEKIKEVVFVNEKGKAKMIEVKTGISDFENIEIVSGLKDGQEIISGPYATVAKKLKEGELVQKKGGKK